MPTYNERDNIRTIVDRLLDVVPDATILVFDDNSPDGTGDIADELAAAHPTVVAHHGAGKAGLGVAYLTAFRWGLDEGYDVFVEIDADGSHPPESLPDVLALLEPPTSASLAIGSRWMRGGKVVNWPKSRELLSRTANVYTRMMLGMGVRDATAGFRAYTREILERIDFDSVESKGYGFQVDMTFRVSRLKARIAETPIVFREREHGESKMSGSIVKEAMLLVTAKGLRRLVPRRSADN